MTKFKRTFLHILLYLCLFVSMGLNSYAFCLPANGCSCHKITKITCSCCHSNLMSKCNCIKEPIRPDSDFKSALSLNQTADIKDLCYLAKPSFNLIIFKTISCNKIHSNQILISNKNLEMLRTVILLN